VLIDGNAAAVVDDGDRAVDVDRDVDLIAEAGQRFVDRVVDDFVDEVVQPAGRSTRCTSPAACGRLRALEDLDLVGAVVFAAPLAAVAVVAGGRPGQAAAASRFFCSVVCSIRFTRASA
jgi:hypothetical protein